MTPLVVLGPSQCEGYYHGDADDPDECDAYEASEIGAPCDYYGARCCEFYPTVDEADPAPVPTPTTDGKGGGK